MSKLVSAIVSFVLVFVCIFFLSEWFVAPHLSFLPSVPVTVRDHQFMVSNWAGIALGILLGLVSARSIVFRKKKKA